MSEYLAYTSGVVRLFDTLDAANAWLAEVGGGQVFVAVERLAAAEDLLREAADAIRSADELTDEDRDLLRAIREALNPPAAKGGA